MDFIRWATGTTDAEMASIPAHWRAMGWLGLVAMLIAAGVRSWRS